MQHVLARWDCGWQCEAWPAHCSKSLSTTNKLCFLLNSDWALMHSATVTNKWPIVANCRRQEANKKPTRDQQNHHMAVFFVEFQMFSKLGDCTTNLIRPSYCAFCLEHQGSQGLRSREGHDTRCKTRRTHCVTVGHKPTDSSCLHPIPQPLFVVSCLCHWFYWQCLHGLQIHSLNSLWMPPRPLNPRCELRWTSTVRGPN